MLGQHPARHVVDLGVGFVTQRDQLRFTLAYRLAKGRNDLLAMLTSPSGRPDRPSSWRSADAPGNRHSLLLDHLAGIGDPQLKVWTTAAFRVRSSVSAAPCFRVASSMACA